MFTSAKRGHGQRLPLVSITAKSVARKDLKAWQSEALPVGAAFEGG